MRKKITTIISGSDPNNFWMLENLCKNFAISDEEINGYQKQINFVLGEKDKLIPLKYVQKFCEGLEKSEILILENLSHFTFYEDPTKLSSELGKLLSK